MFGKNYDNAADHDLRVGDRVAHVRESTLIGTIRVMETNRLSCMVDWDHLLGDDCLDFAWCNKLVKLSAFDCNVSGHVVDDTVVDYDYGSCINCLKEIKIR